MLFGSRVELLVYRTGGSGMPLHQINNTPHLVDIFKKYTSTQVMSVVLPIPDAMKFSRFPIRDKS